METYTLEEYISADVIRAKVAELGNQIAKDYKGKPLMVVGVLKGSFIFMSDLVRDIDLPLELSFIAVSSYESGIASSGSVRLLCDIDRPLKGKHVLLVEDIVDSGYTINYLMEILQVRQPESIKICALLDKPSRRMVDVKADYSGFEVADQFLVGYGLDYAGKHRNLNNIAILNFKK